MSNWREPGYEVELSVSRPSFHNTFPQGCVRPSSVQVSSGPFGLDEIHKGLCTLGFSYSTPAAALNCSLVCATSFPTFLLLPYFFLLPYLPLRHFIYRQHENWFVLAWNFTFSGMKLYLFLLFLFSEDASTVSILFPSAGPCGVLRPLQANFSDCLWNRT